MFWKHARSMSITNRLLLIFVSATVLILLVITGLVYPPMKELLLQSRINHEHHDYLLTQICIKKFFIGLWCSALIAMIASYLLAKKSMLPINSFAKELASINASSLDKRLQEKGHPKELQQLATTCNDMLFRIESTFHHLRKFSASMAHELRNPVHYLQTATEITLAKTQSVEDYKQLLQLHLEEYQNLASLIDNLLFLTRSEHRQIALKPKVLSANNLMNSIIEYYHFVAIEHEIDIRILGDAQIEVDEHLFKRVISNLIDNSITYTPKGGTIIINIEKLSNNSVQIAIKDNGIGIEKEHLPLLCQGFYRVDHSVNKENSGVGLGLAIAKSIMENHKGNLYIESHPQEGTTVTLTLNGIN